MKALYGLDKNSIWWGASDLGWVVGHSYICYGPLLYGATSVMYEGKPDRTPDAAQYFRYLMLVPDNTRLKFIPTQSDLFRFIPKCVSEPVRTHASQSENSILLVES